MILYNLTMWFGKNRLTNIGSEYIKKIICALWFGNERLTNFRMINIYIILIIYFIFNEFKHIKNVENNILLFTYFYKQSNYRESCPELYPEPFALPNL